MSIEDLVKDVARYMKTNNKLWYGQIAIDLLLIFISITLLLNR